MSKPSARQYMSTDLPTLQKGASVDQTQVLLLSLYQEACSTWRMLVDVRFKLYALVPTVSLISLATVFSGGDPTKHFSPWIRLVFAILGLCATIGLLIYELRNSQLHDDLISRGRKIEEELGVHTGIFRGRKVASGLIKHGTATQLIYGAALAAWVAAIFVSGRGF